MLLHKVLNKFDKRTKPPKPNSSLKELKEKDRILYLTDESGNEVPCAILVTGMAMFEPAYSDSTEKHYLMVNPFSEKREETRLLIEYIFFS